MVNVASQMSCECSAERALASAGGSVKEISASVRNATVGEEGAPKIL